MSFIPNCLQTQCELKTLYSVEQQFITQQLYSSGVRQGRKRYAISFRYLAQLSESRVAKQNAYLVLVCPRDSGSLELGGRGEIPPILEQKQTFSFKRAWTLPPNIFRPSYGPEASYCQRPLEKSLCATMIYKSGLISSQGPLTRYMKGRRCGIKFI